MAAPPESTKNSLLYRLHAHARNHWPQITDLHVRYRGQFAYITAELADGATQPLIRLHYGGSAHHWGFGLYLASSDKYEDQILALRATYRQPERSPRLRLRPLPRPPRLKPEQPRRTSNSNH